MKRQTFIRYFQTIVFCLVVTFFCAVFYLLQCVVEMNTEHTLSNHSYAKGVTVVVDAGHGGEDGGAVGISGTLEKDINFAISRYLYDLLKLTDVKVVMTRTGDYMLYEAGQERRKKFNDLNNRVQMCSSFDEPILISIHQNKFPVEKYKGLQVWYSANNDDSRTVADIIQSNTFKYIQHNNNRKIKQAGRNIFLLDRLDCPAVLVECGFLSNSEEEKLLSDSAYQREIAFVIFSSLMDFLSSRDLNMK